MELKRPSRAAPVGGASARDARHGWGDVPWRTILATVGVVLVTLALLVLMMAIARILVLLVIAGFFAIVLAPTVARVQSHLGGRRSLATAIVMFSTAAVVLGLLAVFVMPVRHQALAAVTDLPGTIDAAAQGNGPVGEAVARLHLQSLVRDHEADLQRWADDLQGSSFSIARRVVDVLYTTLTLFVLTFLFLTQSSSLGTTALSFVPARRREAVRRAGVDAAHAVSGYMIGNLLISLVAGVTALVCLVILGVPNPIVLALWVAFADLIPLVGATIGAALAVFAAFLHSPTAGIVAIVFFVLYQQFENYVVQPMVMSRTVKVNPLVVIVSVLVGVQLFGFVGAVLAIPVAGALQVAIRAVWLEVHTARLELSDAALDELSVLPEAER
jgi:predicted PurR-regulated permease PerM